MTDRVIFPVAGQWLCLSREEFDAALAAGSGVMPTNERSPVGGLPSDRLYTAEEMAQRTGVPASWWLSAARERRIAHVLFGKYPRFDLATLAAANQIPAVKR